MHLPSIIFSYTWPRQKQLLRSAMRPKYQHKILRIFRKKDCAQDSKVWEIWDMVHWLPSGFGHKQLIHCFQFWLIELETEQNPIAWIKHTNCMDKWISLTSECSCKRYQWTERNALASYAFWLSTLHCFTFHAWHSGCVTILVNKMCIAHINQHFNRKII